MPKFNTDFEYDQWFERKQTEKILDEYFGKELEKEDEETC